METADLDHRLSELERHYASASADHRRRVAARLRAILSLEDASSRRSLQRTETTEVDLFDNMPV
ncbi:hypothetical protein MLD63_12780 [Paracoccus sp. TK19116]|uniref:DUF465 domain-containing protein n=1 Tax=Paracoccus albicereus TaxID=2922394 RepID=A0ABT1MVG4_9RHOB|nr:hypothetical protein [Paracoccus albicereus]MCQ0971298.1 hypothetical protein [Paracoccus albicereus]